MACKQSNLSARRLFLFMQNIIRKKLKNNLNVEFIVDSSFAYSVICFEFGVGSFHDDKNLMGIAHLFEHLVGKRTKKFR